jgi:hypothetical protein
MIVIQLPHIKHWDRAPRPHALAAMLTSVACVVAVVAGVTICLVV